MKRNNPDTSTEAYASLRKEDLLAIYQKIIGALERLGSASTEQLAAFLTLDHGKVHRRVSEMERLQIIYRPGHRVPTKAGRTAFVWALTSPGAKTEREKALPGKSVVDYSKTIQEIQNCLF